MSRNERNSLLVHIRPRFMASMTILFGSIGLHDFIIKKWARGLLHILLVLTPLAFALLKYNPLNLDSTVMPNIFFWISYCLGILELYFYLKKIKFQTEPEAVVDYNTFTASNRIFLFIFAIITVVEILLLYGIISAISASPSSTYDEHLAVLKELALALVLAVHGIIAIIAAIIFNYSYKLKCRLDNMRYTISQRELKIFTFIDFFYRKIIKSSIALNIGLFIIAMITI